MDMDSTAEGAGSCDEPAPKVKRSSMFRRYQAEVMAARANAQVRRSSDLVRKHRMAEAAQLAAEAAAEVAAAQAAEQAAEQAAAQAAYRANVRDSPPRRCVSISSATYARIIYTHIRTHTELARAHP